VIANGQEAMDTKKMSAAIAIGYREEMEGMSGLSGIVLDKLLNNRRLSLGEGLDRGRGLHLCLRTPCFHRYRRRCSVEAISE
jgi:hypothetical protein